MGLGKLTAFHMTPLGWLGRKTSTQTNTDLENSVLLTSKFYVKFFLLHIFLKAYTLGCWCVVSITTRWLQNSWHHSADAADPKSRSRTQKIVWCLRQSFTWSFFLLHIFLKAYTLGCWCVVSVTTRWLQNSWLHSADAADPRSRSRKIVWCLRQSFTWCFCLLLVISTAYKVCRRGI